MGILILSARAQTALFRMCGENEQLANLCLEQLVEEPDLSLSQILARLNPATAPPNGRGVEDLLVLSR